METHAQNTHSRPSATTLSLSEFIDLRQQPAPVTLVDVRSPAEFAACHLEGALNLPLHEIESGAWPEKLPSSSQPVVVVCQSGRRAQMAAKFLQQRFEKVQILAGGIEACKKIPGPELPLVYGGHMISVERQVRIAAGSLVAAGSWLGATVHPAFSIFAGFVGMGLVYAGITDRCGLGLLLARMPWNARRGVTGSCSLPSTRQPLGEARS